MKNLLVPIILVLISASCSHSTNQLAKSYPAPDLIDLIFSNDSGKQEATIRFIKISPKACIDAGIVKAESPWEQEFVLEAPEAGIEIGETVAECNSPLKITFIKETETRFRLKVTITPKIEHPDFKCLVKIPVFKEKGQEQLNLQITGKVRI